MQSLAVDPSGAKLYVILEGKHGVLRLGPAGEPLAPELLPAAEPTGVAHYALATDTSGNLYVLARCSPEKVPQGPGGAEKEGCLNLANEVLGFDSAGTPIPGMEAGERFAHSPSGFGAPFHAGLATCASSPETLYVSSFTGTAPSASYVSYYGEDLCGPVTAHPPEIGAEYATAVGTDQAVVRAMINPRFAEDTTYYVQYGPAACAESGWEEGCLEEPLPPGRLLTSESASEPLQTAAVTLSGLESATTYHFRFVAQSSGSEGNPVFGAETTFETFPPPPSQNKTDCGNQLFRSGFSAVLPDCRAYEMVSPLDKNGGDVKPFGVALDQSAADGNALTYTSETAFAEPLGAPTSSQYLARRGDAGWSTRSISPARGPQPICDEFHCKLQTEYKAFSPDLCSSWLVHNADPPLASGAAPGFVHLYRRGLCGGDSYETVDNAPPENAGGSNYWPELQGLSADGSCAVFRSAGKLTADASSATESGESPFQLYENCGGRLHYVCLLPGGEATAPCTAGTAQEQFSIGTMNAVANAVSGDGSRIFWTAADTANELGTLYLRDNASQDQSAQVGDECVEPDKACTYPVSQLVSSAAAQFIAGDSSGTRAIFSVGEELYEFHAEEGAFGLETGVSPVAAGFKGTMGSSEDLSRIYFVSTTAPPGAEPNLQGEVPQAGDDNLYLDREGALVFIAALAGVDVTVSQQPSPVDLHPALHLARVSTDGQHLAFMSRGRPTGYDNTDVQSGEPDGEVFLYDAVSKRLVCASCNPSGARPSGAVLAASNGYRAAAHVPAWSTQIFQPRYLSADGSRLFFESFEALVPRDTNGRGDVYEWEAAATQAQCEAQIGGELYVPSSGGCLSLISSGQSAQDSEFLDASPDGHDVFFTTGQSLDPVDPGLIDVYDARAGGGFPAPSQPAAACEGEACQGPPAPPDDPTPASSTYHGAGNVSSGKAKRHHHRKHHHRQRHHARPETRRTAR